MTDLYSTLSQVYEAMYQTFIDYEEEFAFYAQILQKYQCQSLVEIGCGTGNLAPLFTQQDFNYFGLDFSDDMLRIAKEKFPDGQFLQGDMRDFSLKKQVHSALITARSLSYMIENSEVEATFESVYKNLKTGGIFAFDVIDANRFIPDIYHGKKLQHTAIFDGIEYFRNSELSVNLNAKSWTFDWLSTFYKKENEVDILLGKDDSSVRAFTKNDIEILLKMAGFEILEIIDKRAYMFDTLVFVAMKTSHFNEQMPASSCSI